MIVTRRPYPMLAAVAGFMAVNTSAFGQTLPWDTFIDPLSTSVCDVVNAENAELVIWTETGQLVIISGRDVVLEDTYVTPEGDVLFLGEPVGFIAYDTDGDGFRTVWWVSLTGRVVSIDGFTGEPSETNMVPGDFFNVACDACEFWDDPLVCTPPDPAPTPTINVCGTDTVLPLALIFTGLTMTGLVHRRYR